MTNYINDGDIITVDGLRFRVNFEADDCYGHPWDEFDGHGPVRKSRYRHCAGAGSDKRPGERPLNQPGPHEYQFYYDWQEASKLARRDGWNAEPYDTPNRVHRAVSADFEYLRQYVEGMWSYVMVIVQRVDVNDEDITRDVDCVGGVETYKDGHIDYALEMARGIVETARRRWRDALAVTRAERRDAKEAAIAAAAMACTSGV